jgi:hypothetical protein
MGVMMTSSSGSSLVHAFLALYNTPLHDLLAVVGDTWVFGEKLPPQPFSSAQSRLKSWRHSLACAAATQHACHVLHLSLDKNAFSPLPAGVPCISDWWGLYTSALICWAFGHVPFMESEIGSSDSEAKMDVEIGRDVEYLRSTTLHYTKLMMELDVENLLAGKDTSRGDALAAISVVRRQLEREAVGGQPGMLIDAVMTLKRIEERGHVKWF